MNSRTVTAAAIVLLMIAAGVGFAAGRLATRNVLARHSGTIDALEQTVSTLKQTIDTLEQKIAALEREISATGSKIEPLEAGVRQVQIDLSSHLFPDSERDVKGDTPDQVVNRFLEACQRKDWSAAYQCLTGVLVSAADYSKEMEISAESIVQYKVSGFELKSPEQARVFVSLVIRYEDSAKEVEIPTEPWAVLKDHGQWKVRWLPRQ